MECFFEEFDEDEVVPETDCDEFGEESDSDTDTDIIAEIDGMGETIRKLREENSKLKRRAAPCMQRMKAHGEC